MKTASAFLIVFPSSFLIAFFLIVILIFFVLTEIFVRRRALNADEAWPTRPLPAVDEQATRIAILGDSITYGYELAESETWPFLLERRLQREHPHRRWQVFNLSVNGSTAADAYVRFDSLLRPLRPHMVIMALGLNDCRQVYRGIDRRRITQFRRNEQTWWGRSHLLRALFYRLRPLPQPDYALNPPDPGPRIPPETFRDILTWLAKQTRRLGAQPVFLTLTPISPNLDATRRREFARREAYNAIIREVARDASAPFIELSHRFPAGQPWLADGVHLSPQGEAFVADRVWTGLHRPQLAAALSLQTQVSNAEMAPSLD
ncbi:MAG: hypothetical protein GXP42_10505 [Chloroflexi bacterium]|nr:hypothetical protein [Chloroflexota bacterium]